MMASRAAIVLLLLLLLFLFSCVAISDSNATASAALPSVSSGHINARRRRTVVAERKLGRSGSGSGGGSVRSIPAGVRSSPARGQGGSLGQPSGRGGSVAAAQRDHRVNAGCANHFHRHFAITFILISWLLLLLLW